MSFLYMHDDSINNYRAVRNQHVLPKASIERFYSDKRFVHAMFFKKNNKIFPIKSRNKLFVAERKLDESIEKSVNALEEKFQDVMDKVINGDPLNEPEYKIANMFYAILSERSRARYHEFDNTPSLFDVNTINYSEMSEQEREFNESQGVIVIRSASDGVYERFARGLSITQAIQNSAIQNDTWGIYTTSDEFIVSDSYHFHKIIPVSPTIYLVKNKDNLHLNKSETYDFNKLLRETSLKYVFSRNIEALN